MPGTGKTATTMEVIQGLKKNFKFSFQPINAMSLTNPNLVYTIIYEKITGWLKPGSVYPEVVDVKGALTGGALYGGSPADFVS